MTATPEKFRRIPRLHADVGMGQAEALLHLLFSQLKPFVPGWDCHRCRVDNTRQQTLNTQDYRMYNRLTWLGFNFRDNIKLQGDLHSLKAASSCLLYKLRLSAPGRLRWTTKTFTSHKPPGQEEGWGAGWTHTLAETFWCGHPRFSHYIKNYMRKKCMLTVLSTHRLPWVKYLKMPKRIKPNTETALLHRNSTFWKF